MKQREGPLDLDKNLGKTMVVQNAGTRGPGVPGFFCEACNRTYKDSSGYLDHINGRARKCCALASIARQVSDALAQIYARWDRRHGYSGPLCSRSAHE